MAVRLSASVGPRQGGLWDYIYRSPALPRHTRHTHVTGAHPRTASGSSISTRSQSIRGRSAWGCLRRDATVTFAMAPPYEGGGVRWGVNGRDGATTGVFRCTKRWAALWWSRAAAARRWMAQMRADAVPSGGGQAGPQWATHQNGHGAERDGVLGVEAQHEEVQRYQQAAAPQATCHDQQGQPTSACRTRFRASDLSHTRKR